MNKLTAEEILKIVEENYSINSFCEGQWDEIEDEGSPLNNYELNEVSRQLVEKKQVLLDKLKSHPLHQASFEGKLASEEYQQILKEYSEIPSEWDLIREAILEHLGLGKVVEVDSYGGEGSGEEYYSVKHFVDHDVYIRTDGFYQSYNGVEFYNGYGSEVFPVEVTKTEYHTKPKS